MKRISKRSLKLAIIAGIGAMFSGCLDPITSETSSGTPIFDNTGNTAPEISGSAPTEAQVDLAYSFTPTATDPDGDTLTFDIQGKPSWATFDSDFGTLSGVPTTGDVGMFQDIVISAYDGTSSASLQPFSISVISGSGGFEPPPNPSAYRGIPDPSSALGFDVWGTFPVDQTIAGSRGEESLSCEGTAEQPCVIDASAATFTKLTVSGSYVILQGGFINAPSGSGLWFRSSGCSNCVIRDVEVAGPGVDAGNSAAAGIGSHNVWIRGSVHGFGDNRVDAPEQDFHGFKIMTTDVWILEAEIYDVSGDSVQVGDASRGSGERVYVGGGYFHHNRENAVDIKDSRDVVVSGVLMEGFRPTSSSPGEAVIIHDDAFNAKVFDNMIRDTTLGIVSSGRDGHIISGNDIQASRVGIQLRNTSNITVIDNTISAPIRIEVQGGVTGTIQD